MFYDNYLRICEEKGLSPSRVLTELNISRGSLGRWKTGGKPRNEYKKKIADYLGVTVHDLMCEQTEKEMHPDNTPGVLSTKENILLAMYRSLPADQRSVLLAMIEAALKSQGLL